MMLATIVILCLTATVSFGALGKCPTPKTKAGFSLEQFAGTWYEIESSAAVDKIAKKCSNFKIEIKETNKNKAGLLHKYISSITGSSKSEYSEIAIIKSSDPGKLQISPLKGGSFLGNKWTLNIIDTDYDTWAIGYSCRRLFVAHVEEVFILAREKTLDDKKKMELYEILKKNDINQKNLMTVSQDDKECSE